MARRKGPVARWLARRRQRKAEALAPAPAARQDTKPAGPPIACPVETAEMCKAAGIPHRTAQFIRAKIAKKDLRRRVNAAAAIEEMVAAADGKYGIDSDLADRLIETNATPEGARLVIAAMLPANVKS